MKIRTIVHSKEMIQISSSLFLARCCKHIYANFSHNCKQTQINPFEQKPGEAANPTHASLNPSFLKDFHFPSLFLHSYKFISIPFSATSHHLVATTARLYLFFCANHQLASTLNQQPFPIPNSDAVVQFGLSSTNPETIQKG